MSWLYLILALAAICFLRRLVLPPSNFPKNIPTIPFYVVFIPMLTNYDQEAIFMKYFRDKLERFGAVKMYFGSQWNILVTRPEYVAQIIRNNDIFEKSGNSEKMPHAVVSEYLGDNIISAGNDNWRQYRKVMTNSILFPDTQYIDKHLKTLMAVLESETQTQTAVVVPGLLQRFFLACIGDCVLGCNLDTEVHGQTILDRVRYLKRQIFRPLYMNFADLDRLSIPTRTRAREALREFKTLLRRKILSERTQENSPRLGSQLAAAYERGEITERQFEDNAIIALVAGHENPEMLLSTVLYMLAKHTQVQRKLRTHLFEAGPDGKEDVPYLSAVIFESLRLYPPIGQLVNRVTRQNTCLGKDIFIPKGVYIGLNSLATQRDRNCWPDADSFVPERWGDSEKEIMQKYTLAKSKCELTAFHGRNRACLGEKFALLEVRKSVVAILLKYEFTLDPNWHERITPIGPIWPVQLSLKFTKLSEKEDARRG